MSTQTPRAPRGATSAQGGRSALLLYALALLVVLFSPTSHVQASLVVHLGDALQVVLPDSWVTFTRVEILMNVVIIAPLTFIGSIVWPRLRWQEWTAYGFLGATMVELVQGILLPGRHASFSDIFANTAGALLGALLARLHAELRRGRQSESCTVLPPSRIFGALSPVCVSVARVTKGFGM